MKKLSALSCALVLVTALLGGCAVTPEPSESTPDTATTTIALTDPMTAETTGTGYRSEYPVFFTVAEYRLFLTEVAKNPEHITDMIAKDGFYKPEHFREWFVDKTAYLPCLPQGWSFSGWNGVSGHEAVLEQSGSYNCLVTTSDFWIWIYHRMYDDENLKAELPYHFGEDWMVHNYDRQTLTTRDGWQGEYVYYDISKEHKDGDLLQSKKCRFWVILDGYPWMLEASVRRDSDPEMFKEFIRSLSFEKIEL